jgi:putative transposase
MLHYRQKGNYLVHQFVVMPDHFHLLLTPTEVTLERSLQYIKGAFSYRAGKEFGWKREIWQTSFADRRVRDLSEYQGFTRYIHQNPVRRGLAPTPESFPYSSANGRFPLDPIPQRLKPSSV